MYSNVAHQLSDNSMISTLPVSMKVMGRVKSSSRGVGVGVGVGGGGGVGWGKGLGLGLGVGGLPLV